MPCCLGDMPRSTSARLPLSTAEGSSFVASRYMYRYIFRIWSDASALKISKTIQGQAITLLGCCVGGGVRAPEKQSLYATIKWFCQRGEPGFIGFLHQRPADMMSPKNTPVAPPGSRVFVTPKPRNREPAGLTTGAVERSESLGLDF